MLKLRAGLVLLHADDCWVSSVQLAGPARNSHAVTKHRPIGEGGGGSCRGLHVHPPLNNSMQSGIFNAVTNKILGCWGTCIFYRLSVRIREKISSHRLHQTRMRCECWIAGEHIWYAVT